MQETGCTAAQSQAGANVVLFANKYVHLLVANWRKLEEYAMMFTAKDVSRGKEGLAGFLSFRTSPGQGRTLLAAKHHLIR